MKARALSLVWVLLALAVLLAGCSSLRLGYPWADWYLLRQVNSYFDLTGPQKKEAKARIAQLALWHRTQELPEYAAYLTEIGAKVDQGLTRPDLDRFFARYQELRHRFYAGLVGQAAPWMAGLEPGQFGLLQKKLAEENQELEEDLIKPASEQEAKRIKWVAGLLEDWIGDLTPAQREQTKTFLAGQPSLEPDRLAYRKSSQREFFARLPELKTPEAFQAELTQLWVTSYEEEISPYQAKVLATQEAYKRFLLELALNLTREQKRHLQRKVGAVVSDLIALSR
ncbi:MAG: hypothetical protein A2600_11850 [Candidatus Lambdaproteobacteria bacterium RIFOXYD1_FULL_56_27]|uniref:Lipoprotein n=1 Tax=Candidatus Lambdaproteobacteria bacterium RIFOXYD2_FULL_56_26 TaxID=1817773 RepID=A0A1F6GXK6_9PROT|nr:MAG: hypothetical protein A2426_12185 [Candidatus Lambdaproteobacteria bacterium RIFOXYC1_FULL_56_13]OGH02792.1 MAG: hypothetical protein A2557_02965 [Candidatus Lambdaproteobacteria bacterium RIFOXYD2_FULL_56_26]OGH08035.1 MAG: hypothetical protein A2600_11850 [Candidatus Lambdaproteobacteria bacterium RIFOXYD1_FULL_56_27]